MPFIIRYKFKDDDQFYEVAVTYAQFKQFRKLPIVKECEIVSEDETNLENYKNDLQDALNQAAKNDTTHIKKLSSKL